LAVTAWLFTINEINAAIFKARKKKLYIKTSLQAVVFGQRKNKNKSQK
jgi:hypothetical protein